MILNYIHVIMPNIMLLQEKFNLILILYMIEIEPPFYVYTIKELIYTIFAYIFYTMT